MKSGLSTITAYAKSVSKPVERPTLSAVPQAPEVQPEDGYQGKGSFDRLFARACEEAGKRYTGAALKPQAVEEMGRLNDEIERLLKIGKEQEEAQDTGVHDTFRAFRRVVERWYRVWVEAKKGDV